MLSKAVAFLKYFKNLGHSKKPTENFRVSMAANRFSYPRTTESTNVPTATTFSKVDKDRAKLLESEIPAGRTISVVRETEV